MITDGLSWTSKVTPSAVCFHGSEGLVLCTGTKKANIQGEGCVAEYMPPVSPRNGFGDTWLHT